MSESIRRDPAGPVSDDQVAFPGANQRLVEHAGRKARHGRYKLAGKLPADCSSDLHDLLRGPEAVQAGAEQVVKRARELLDRHSSTDLLPLVLPADTPVQEGP